MALRTDTLKNFCGDLKTVLIEQGAPDPGQIAPKYLDDVARSIPTSGTPTPSDGWVRPFDRPAPPVIGEDEQVIYELFGVGQYSPNDNAFRMTTSTGQYRVDWGDGTVEDYNSGTTAEHIYDYDSLAAPVGSEGYKWVWVKVTPLTGDLTAVTLHSVRHSLRPAASAVSIFIPQVFEIYMRGSEITNLSNSASSYTQLRLCDVFHFYGTHKISSLDSFCYNYYNLKRLIMDVNNATGSFLQGCYSYNQPFPDGVTFSKATASFMFYCYSYNQPFPDSVTFSAVTTNFMCNCYSYNQPFPDGATFANATGSFMSGCYSYNQVFPSGNTFSTITTAFMQDCYSYNQPFPSGATFANATTYFLSGCSSYNQPFPDGITFGSITTAFMQNCRSYNQPLVLTLQNVTAIGTAFLSAGCHALKSLRLLNMGAVHTALTISNSSLDVPALVALFGDLYDRSETTSGTITITNVYGASRLTAEQRAIATSRNWVIVG